MVVAPVVALLPDLKFGFFLEDAHEHRRAGLHAFLGKQRQGVFR